MSALFAQVIRMSMVFAQAVRANVLFARTSKPPGPVGYRARAAKKYHENKPRDTRAPYCAWRASQLWSCPFSTTTSRASGGFSVRLHGS